MKLTRALVPIAAAALLLAGCSAADDAEKTDTSDAAPADCLASGSASEQVKVTGDLGAEELELDSETPIQSAELERSVLIEGEGPAPETDQEVNIVLTFFSGADGTLLQHAGTQAVPNTQASLNEWAYEAVRCSAKGQRVAMVMPAETALADAAESYGLSSDDSVIAVLDVTGFAPGTLDASELLEKASGTEHEAPEGFPTVELADNGEPTITIPEGAEAPSELQVETLIEGDGEVVKEGDRVYVNYRGIIWRTGEEFDSSWSRGAPIDFTTDGVIRGFSEALVGQKVGSQVISIVPAEDGGYGAAKLEEMGHQGDDVMVFVLDILGVAHAE